MSKHKYLYKFSNYRWMRMAIIANLSAFKKKQSGKWSKVREKTGNFEMDN